MRNILSAARAPERRPSRAREGGLLQSRAQYSDAGHSRPRLGTDMVDRRVFLTGSDADLEALAAYLTRR
jgi:hypothetical protein